MLEIAVLNSQEHFQISVTDPRFTIGSQSDEGKNRIVVHDEWVSDFQCECELLGGADGKPMLRVTNLGRSMVVGDSSRLHHLVTGEYSLPVTLGVGETQLEFSSSDYRSPLDKSIQRLTNIGSSSTQAIANQKKRNEISPSPETLSSWFETLGQIQRSTAGQKAFFELAARSVFNPGGLDGCIILRRQNETWSIVAQYIPYPEHGISFRKDLVEQVCSSKLSLFHDSSMIDSGIELGDSHAAVVCPVLDVDGEVVSMVYGFRSNRKNNARRGIRLLEAKFVSLITDSIAAGMIRLNHEANRARQRVLLEQAFSPEVAEHLEANPDFLNGQDREVTVLFADLRGFCRISESVGASVTYQLLTDVMNRFTEIVHDHHGVVIDFYGDGMSAFWNAPVDQPDHAVLACKAGMAINAVMTELNDIWSVEIGHRLRVGVGVHTGIAQVGNSGSQNRLKYGPQGTTVNIASRLEQSTKRLGVNMVVSGETAERVGEYFVAQRICTGKLNGIKAPTDLMFLVDPKDYSKQTGYYLGYSEALEEFESGNLIGALVTLTEIADSIETAQPMLSFLLEEINGRMKNESGTANNDQPCITTPASEAVQENVVVIG